MKKAVVGILNRVPVVLIVIGEALVIYLATAVAKLAFTQLDPLYSVWYRVGFMAVLLLLWRIAHSKTPLLLESSARCLRLLFQKGGDDGGD